MGAHQTSLFPPSLFLASVSRCLTGLTTMATCVSPLNSWALAPSISSKTTTTCPTLSTKCATWPSSCARLSSVSGVGQGGLGQPFPPLDLLSLGCVLVKPLHSQLLIIFSSFIHCHVDITSDVTLWLMSLIALTVHSTCRNWKKKSLKPKHLTFLLFLPFPLSWGSVS